MYSVCTVIYGDYPELAEKLLASLRFKLGPATDLRIGLNDVSDATRNAVWDFCGNRVRLPCYVYEPPLNVGKYPLMRRMFYDAKRPLAEYVMWFDDDSHLGDAVGNDWWKAVSDATKNYDMIGRVHTIRQRKNQYLAIPHQPWFGGQPVKKDHVYRFLTGGWWVAASGFLRQWSYPFPAIHHNGGDSILGELVRQQKKRLYHFPRAQCHCEACQRKREPSRMDAVHINVGGRKGRRGIGVRNEFYVWQDGNLDVDLSFHQFDCKVYVFGAP